jgi:hypothetical protein
MLFRRIEIFCDPNRTPPHLIYVRTGNRPGFGGGSLNMPLGQLVERLSYQSCAYRWPRYRKPVVFVNPVGVGAGVVDRLRSRGIRVRASIPSWALQGP